MPRPKKVSESAQSRRRPALDPDAREGQMISLAVDLAERQLAEGTASSQVITHFLKLGSSKARIEQEMLTKQTELLTAKTEALQSAKRIEELYAEAMAAMRAYTPNSSGGADHADD